MKDASSSLAVAPSIEKRAVPFFNYPHVYTSDRESVDSAIRSVCERGAFILQDDLKHFEQHLAAFANCRHALGVANGTDALFLALIALGVGRGDEVIFSSHTFVATAAAIHIAGATPVPVECGPDHLIDPAAVAAAVTPRTRCLMPTQLNGRTCDMAALGEVAKKHSLHIVEDAAQALGSKFRGRCAGTFGAAGTISFYPAKSLGCFGDGGGVLTNDDGLFERMHALRDHGRDATGEVVAWGFNSRLDNLHAAILDSKLKTFSAVIERRRKLAALYDLLLRDVSEVVLPPAPNANSDHFDTYQNYEIEAERRDDLKAFLKEQGVGTLIQWGGKAVHQFEKLGFRVRLPYTERLFERCLMLPMNMSLADDDVMYVCETIKRFYSKRS